MELDQGISADQWHALMHIVTGFIGGARLPILILDQSSILAYGSGSSAQAVRILGFPTPTWRCVFTPRRSSILDPPVIHMFLK